MELLYLIHPVLLHGLGLVEPLQSAVHPLVEAPVMVHGGVHDVEVLEDVPCGLDSTLEGGGVDKVELEPLLLDGLRRSVGLRYSRGSERDVDPSGETVLNVPLALTVANQDECVDLDIKSERRRRGGC